MNLNILKALMFTPMPEGKWGVPSLFWGSPGVGKTSIVKQFGENWGLPTEILSPAARGQGAFGVVPVPKNGVITYPFPEWTERMHECGLVAIDELSCSDSWLQAPLLGLAADRYIGGAYLAPRVRVMAMSNPVTEAANGTNLSIPLANRFVHLNSDSPTVDEHAQYELCGGVTNHSKHNALEEEDRVTKLWPEAYSEAVGRKIAFLQTRPDYKNRVPKPGSPSASRAWPSDRTWTMLTRCEAGAKIHGLRDTETDLLLEGCVGGETYETYAMFRKENDIGKATDYLDGKVPFEWNDKQLDRCAAIISACTAYLVVNKDSEKRDERGQRMWEMLGKTTNYDFVIPSLYSLAKEKIAIKTPIAIKTMSKLLEVVEIAGISGASLV